MAKTWTPLVLPPRDREPVDQKTTARSIDALTKRTEYLRQRLEEFSAQNGKIVIQNAKTDSQVGVGDWVYFDDSADRYRKAIAEGELDQSTGTYVATKRSFVVGVCIDKESSQIGTILSFGWVGDLADYSIDPENMLEDLIGEEFTPGRYYLSRKTPGKMTKTPGSPLVQLGFFTEDFAFISPIQKDIFESHFHYEFPLASKPSASQNFSMSGWSNVGNASGKRWVDYFNDNTSGDSPVIIMSVKKNANEASYEECRVDLFRRSSDSRLGIEINSGSGLDHDDPQSTGTITGHNMDWPEYGEWIEIPETNLSVSFSRTDATYSDSLEDDAASILTATTDRYKVFLPNDLVGWTNANHFDTDTPTNAFYRYIVEDDSSLDSVWPPVPLAAGNVLNNGIHLVLDQDFVLSNQNIFWIPSTYSSSRTVSPWPHDYNAESTHVPNAAYARNIQVHFTKSGINNARNVVLSLKSINPALKITDCFTGSDAQAGHLNIDLQLQLNTLEEILTDVQTTIYRIDPATQKFQLSNVVTMLDAGSGIQISRTNGGAGSSGRLTVSRKDLKFEGDVSIVSLKNAKEDLYRGVVPYVYFLTPGTKCQLISRVKVPNQDIPNDKVIDLGIWGRVFGTVPVGSGQNQVAVFKAVHYVVRAGTNLNDLVENKAFLKQEWTIQLDSYSSYDILAAEYPNVGSLTTDPSTITIKNSEATWPDGAGEHLEAGDSILTVLERVQQDTLGNADNYQGNIGITGLRWSIDLVSS